MPAISIVTEVTERIPRKAWHRGLGSGYGADAALGTIDVDQIGEMFAKKNVAS